MFGTLTSLPNLVFLYSPGWSQWKRRKVDSKITERLSIKVLGKFSTCNARGTIYGRWRNMWSSCVNTVSGMQILYISFAVKYPDYPHCFGYGLFACKKKRVKKVQLCSLLSVQTKIPEEFQLLLTFFRTPTNKFFPVACAFPKCFH